MNALNTTIYRGLGRRKSAVARVILTEGDGQFIINKKKAKKYLISDLLIQDAKQPLTITNTNDKFNVNVNVRGGGLAGQAGAIKLGITRALLKISLEYQKSLKKVKLTTRDARIKERKKPGLRKARRARQFSKR